MHRTISPRKVTGASTLPASWKMSMKPLMCRGSSAIIPHLQTAASTKKLRTRHHTQQNLHLFSRWIVGELKACLQQPGSMAVSSSLPGNNCRRGHMLNCSRVLRAPVGFLLRKRDESKLVVSLFNGGRYSHHTLKAGSAENGACATLYFLHTADWLFLFIELRGA